MKNLLFIILLFPFMSGAQNLVPNPGFEDTTNCSIDNQIFRTPPWQQPTNGTPDWFNPCSSSPNGSTVPFNDFGFQNAQDGTSYAGFILYVNGLYYREYIQAQLLSNLISGVKYWVSFHISLADSSEYAIKEIGAYFSTVAVNSSDIIPLPYTPQIKSGNTFLTNKTNWTTISGTFIANGGENFITIGNFQDSTSIDTLNVGGSGIGLGTNYYYIDNICVSSDSTICDFTVGFKEHDITANVEVYPNPFSTTTTLEIPVDFIYGNTSFYLYDILGNMVKKQSITETKTYIKRDFIPAGIYILRITNSHNQQCLKKIIIK